MSDGESQDVQAQQQALELPTKLPRLPLADAKVETLIGPGGLETRYFTGPQRSGIYAAIAFFNQPEVDRSEHQLAIEFIMDVDPRERHYVASEVHSPRLNSRLQLDVMNGVDTDHDHPYIRQAVRGRRYNAAAWDVFGIDAEFDRQRYGVDTHWVAQSKAYSTISAASMLPERFHVYPNVPLSCLEIVTDLTDWLFAIVRLHKGLWSPS